MEFQGHLEMKLFCPEISLSRRQKFLERTSYFHKLCKVNFKSRDPHKNILSGFNQGTELAIPWNLSPQYTNLKNCHKVIV